MLNSPAFSSSAKTWVNIKIKAYMSLVKYLQTSLLVITGLAGYMSGRGSHPNLKNYVGLIGSLFLAVGGSTVVNMVIDCDIDAKMDRTSKRPIPNGIVNTQEGGFVGVTMIILGIIWATTLSLPYTLTLTAGVFFDVIIYTQWLKRRTPWAILWGGIAGGMPILAGRTLAIGMPDAIGFLLALAILLWIPTHIMTLSIKYSNDYAKAKIPVFPNYYGLKATRWTIGLSTSGAIIVMLGTIYLIGVQPILLWFARGLGSTLFGFTMASIFIPTSKLNTILFKLASLYMLGSMILLIAST